MNNKFHTVKPNKFSTSDTGPRVFNKKSIIELTQGQNSIELDRKLLLERRQLVGVTVRPPASGNFDLKVSATQKMTTREVFESASLIIWEGETKIIEVPFTEIERVQQFEAYYPLNIGQINLDKTTIEVWNNANIVDKDVLIIYPVYLKPLKKSKV